MQPAHDLSLRERVMVRSVRGGNNNSRAWQRHGLDVLRQRSALEHVTELQAREAGKREHRARAQSVLQEPATRKVMLHDNPAFASRPAFSPHSRRLEPDDNARIPVGFVSGTMTSPAAANLHAPANAD